jgi:predicted GIY-YIG superfamily endonuclease
MPETPERTALYRLYDAEDQLLYIGISSSPTRRWRQHERDKGWWPQVAKLVMVWLDSRLDAQSAEGHAIKAEGPLHNVIGTKEEESEVAVENEPMVFNMLDFPWA